MRPLVLAALVQLASLPAAFGASRFDTPPVDPAAPVASDPVKARVIIPVACASPILTVERVGTAIDVRHQGPENDCPTQPHDRLIEVPLGVLPAGVYVMRLLDVSDPPSGIAVEDEATFTVAESPSACFGSLCLRGGRFIVSVEWTTATDHGAGLPLPLTYETGGFWFFDDDNLEVFVKVIDACEYNGHFWVFATGMTDVGVVLRVHDGVSGRDRTYTRPRGSLFQPIADTQGFECH
jgi:hypothetical protein